MSELIQLLNAIIQLSEIKYLGNDGTKYLIEFFIKSLSDKLNSSQLVSLSLDEYNELFNKNQIKDDTYYFIIDKEDELFEKIKEMSEKIETLESGLKEVSDFKNQFPVDNRTYGIINQQPKNLSEVFPDELGIPSDKNDPNNPETPEIVEE